MNVACIPYHDWRKIEMEGARTRDSHIIAHLNHNDNIDNLIIINRPITYTELWLKKKRQKISGEKVFSYGNLTLYRLADNMYVVDYFSSDLLGPIIKNKTWFFKSYGDALFVEGFKKAMEFIGIEIDIIYNQNIFAAEFISQLALPCVFDAWDNFILFPENKRFENLYFKAYQDLSSLAKVWTTNSVKNIAYYQEHYSPSECILIKNGVDIDKFKKQYSKPVDLKDLASPIIGFGGKITHLFNYELFNYTVDKHLDKNFVIVGQVLDKEVFKKISTSSNVHYLGDKHYSQYASYVTNFDLGIIPYVTDHLEHGADSIKMYEYLASGLNVVGTSGAGMNEMSSYIYISDNKEEFSNNIDDALKKSEYVELPQFHTWEYKTIETITAFNKVLTLTNLTDDEKL